MCPRQDLPRSAPADAVRDPRILTIVGLQRPAATCSIHLLTICSVLLSSSVAYGTSACNAGPRRRACIHLPHRGGAGLCTDPPHRGANLHRPSVPGRQPASTLHTGGDWPHRPFAPGWLTAPDEAAGGTGVETGGTGATTPPCPPSNATPGRGPLHPRRSTPPTMRAETTAERRDHGGAQSSGSPCGR